MVYCNASHLKHDLALIVFLTIGIDIPQSGRQYGCEIQAVALQPLLEETDIAQAGRPKFIELKNPKLNITISTLLGTQPQDAAHSHSPNVD